MRKPRLRLREETCPSPLVGSGKVGAESQLDLTKVYVLSIIL